MKKWKEVSPYSGRPIGEDAPANSVAGGGVSMPPDAIQDKKRRKRISDEVKEIHSFLEKEKVNFSLNGYKIVQQNSLFLINLQYLSRELLPIVLIEY